MFKVQLMGFIRNLVEIEVSCTRKMLRLEFLCRFALRAGHEPAHVNRHSLVSAGTEFALHFARSEQVRCGAHGREKR